MAATVTEENGKFYLNFNGNKFSYNSRDKAESAAFQLNTGAQANVTTGGTTTKYNQGAGSVDSTAGQTSSTTSNSSSSSSNNTNTSSSSSSSSREYNSKAEQEKKYGISMDSADIGKATRVSMDEGSIQPRGSFPPIKSTGDYVVVDVMRNGSVLRQSIYGPDGRFIKSVNPRSTEAWAQTDVNEALIEVQAERHGTQEQAVQAYQQQFDRTLLRAQNVNSATADPTIVNRIIAVDAGNLAAAKLGINYSDWSWLQGNVISQADRKLDYLNIARADNPLAAMTTQVATINTQTNNASRYLNGTGTDFLSTTGQPNQVKTSNGYSLVYFGDPEADTQREAVVGRIGIASADGVYLTTLGDGGRRTADIMSRITGKELNGVEATLALYGVGSVNPEEVKATFGELPLFRTTGYVNEDYVDPATGTRPVIDQRLESQNSIISSITNWTGSELYVPDSYSNFTDFYQYQPGGDLYAQTQANLAQLAADNDAEIASQRTTRTTAGTAPSGTPSATPTTGTINTSYQTTTPGVTQAPTTSTGTPVAVAPTPPAGTTYPQQPVTGTFPSGTQTGGLGAIPGEVPAMPSGVAGYDVSDLTSTAPGVSSGSNVGVQTVNYTNQFGQSIPVTVVNGKPVTYVPPGYTRTGAAEGGLMRSGYAEGGVASEDTMLEAKYRIATMNGYNGPKTNASLNAFANASEGMKRKFNAIGTVMANKGGYIRKGFEEGGDVTNNAAVFTPGPFQTETAEQYKSLIGQTMQPMQAPVAQIEPQTFDFIPTTAGQLSTVAPMAQAATVGNVEQAQMAEMAPAAAVQTTMAAPQVQQATAQLQAAQGTVAPEAQVQAAQQQGSSVTGMQAAQGQAVMVNAPAAREIQQGELISGVADAQKAAQFNEQIQAATATPTAQATVQGQLEGLMQQFEGGETPAWAAGSMRTAMATLSARGLGASSMAGQAVIQATMEAALPIAQMDAQTTAQFEAQNLSNRQQRAMLAAQQRATFLGMEFDQAFQARVQNSARIGDVANMNFTAEQNIALENSRAANTMELNNLSNRQAMVMAEAAALSQLDTQNLNNRQQAAVQNAQNFLQMDMTNLSNEQQTAMFKSQQNLQALFTDQAATNAAAQFNAANENQTNQFFASLTSQTSQFNAAQQNAMDQFNVNSVNALREFNSEIQQQRDLFNAQNGLVVAQANAQWRQNIATINNAQQNQSNMDFAKTMNALTASNMDQIWQRERDIMSFSFASAESAADRAANIALAKLTADEQASLQDSIGKGKLLAIGVDKLLDKWLG